MFAFLDPPEIILIIVVVLVLFGGAQLPKLAKNLGKAQQEFKSGLSATSFGSFHFLMSPRKIPTSAPCVKHRR